MRCCCGKYELEDGEPLSVNGNVHEVLGPEGNFCGPRDHHVIRDLRDENETLKGQLVVAKTKVSEYSGKWGRAIDRQQEYFLENTALRHKVAELEKELQQRRDDEPRRMLEWRGISEELGAKVCKACSGSGVRGYANTATWRGGIGGQMITTDICDKCWGSGDLNRPWLDLRHHAEITKKLAAAKAEVGNL